MSIPSFRLGNRLPNVLDNQYPPLGNVIGQSEPTGQDNSAGLALVPGDYKQKLAIIPFENLNEDEGDGLLVDGIVEDLITEFSMIKELEIVSRKACFDMRQSAYYLAVLGER